MRVGLREMTSNTPRLCRALFALLKVWRQALWRIPPTWAGIHRLFRVWLDFLLSGVRWRSHIEASMKISPCSREINNLTPWQSDQLLLTREYYIQASSCSEQSILHINTKQRKKLFPFRENALWDEVSSTVVVISFEGSQCRLNSMLGKISNVTSHCRTC